MINVREINDVGELIEYRSVWEALLAETGDATFFQSLDWLNVYWRHYGSNQKLRVLIVFAGTEPVGILPLVVRKERTKVGRVRFLTYPLDYWGSFYGPIGPLPEETLDAGLAHVLRTRRDWDALEPRWVGGGAEPCLRTENAMRSLGLQARQTTIDHTAIITLEGTWEEYLASHTSKWRNNYRRWNRRLGERGEATYSRYRPGGEARGEGDPRWDLWEACLSIARASWQGSSEDGTTLSHPAVEPFLRDVHAVAAKAGALDLNLLLIDREPVAFAYNYHYRGHVYGLRVGYDPATAPDGAGNALYGRIIEDSFQRGDRIYDMGPGSLECKRYFQTSILPVYRYSHFPMLAVRSQLLRLKRYMDASSAAPATPLGP